MGVNVWIKELIMVDGPWPPGPSLGLLHSPFHILIGSKSPLQGGQTRGSNYFIKTEIMNNSIWGEKGITD